MSPYQKWILVASGEWEYRPNGSVCGLIKRTCNGYKWAAADRSGTEPRYDQAQQQIRNMIRRSL